MINQKVGLLNTIYTLALFALNVTEKERNYPKNLFLHTIFLSILFGILQTYIWDLLSWVYHNNRVPILLPVLFFSPVQISIIKELHLQLYFSHISTQKDFVCNCICTSIFTCACTICIFSPVHISTHKIESLLLHRWLFPVFVFLTISTICFPPPTYISSHCREPSVVSSTSWRCGVFIAVFDDPPWWSGHLKIFPLGEGKCQNHALWFSLGWLLFFTSTLAQLVHLRCW